MRVTIDIPKEFEKHFNNDRFEDSLKRLKADAGECMAGLYEIELCEMLIEAFKEAEVKEDEERWLSKNPYLLKRWLETR